MNSRMCSATVTIFGMIAPLVHLTLVSILWISMGALTIEAGASASLGGAGLHITARGELMATRDGKIWNKPAFGFQTFMRDVTCGASQFIAVGGSYVDRRCVILRSRDGRAFSETRVPCKSPLYGVAYGGGHFVAVGDRGQIVISRDGRSWKRAPR